MFRHEGPGRSTTQNCIVAGYLALVGGFVNCASFVLIGAFTSHVTGNVARLGTSVAARSYGSALDILTMVAAFFSGAFLSSMMTESTFFGRRSNAYAVALTTEATLLGIVFTEMLRGRDAQVPALLLCAAMGMQNSLVTRLSGAIVRTTHLTGVITDLGIEAARWFRWWRRSLSTKLGVTLAFGANATERPARQKTLLLGTIGGAFTLGSVAGAVAALRFAREALVIPAALLLACAGYAFATGHIAARSEENARR